MWWRYHCICIVCVRVCVLCGVHFAKFLNATFAFSLSLSLYFRRLFAFTSCVHGPTDPTYAVICTHFPLRRARSPALSLYVRFLSCVYVCICYMFSLRYLSPTISVFELAVCVCGVCFFFTPPPFLQFADAVGWAVYYYITFITC